MRGGGETGRGAIGAMRKMLWEMMMTGVPNQGEESDLVRVSG